MIYAEIINKCYTIQLLITIMTRKTPLLLKKHGNSAPKTNLNYRYSQLITILLMNQQNENTFKLIIKNKEKIKFFYSNFFILLFIHSTIILIVIFVYNERINWDILYLIYFYMEDISDLPTWQPEKVLATLKENPLTIKNLKTKLDKIYMINSYNEREYLPDVIDAYHWIKLVVELPSLDPIFQNEKTQKFFIEDFIYTAIKYMELCRQFKMLEMMVYTQQMMIEGLRVFNKYFDQLEKYPRMTLILKHTFDYEKPFFKTNYTNQYHCLVIPPSKQLIQNVDHFVSGLKLGDKVDVLKIQHQSRRACWLPGTFRKASALYMHIRCDHEKPSISLDLNTLQVRPHQSMKSQYQWRFNLKVGDKVDYLKDINNWIRTQIQQVREFIDPTDQNIKYIEVRVKDDSQYWNSITDPKLQKQGSITKMRPDGRLEQEFILEDFNEYILDPEMTQTFITRSDISKSRLIIDLLKYAHEQLHLFEKIAKVVKDKTMKIEVVADLINFVLIVQLLFHRKFAVQYLIEFTASILDYINNGKQGTIRNFSKQRYEAVMSSLQQFSKRLYPTSERKQLVEAFQLDMILRFLFSDFLDRKLQAVSLLTSMFKFCRHGITKRSIKSFVQWVRENKILPAIYNEKSHSQLIAKSGDFLKHYLEVNPTIEQLQPLLIWNEAIIKLVAQNFEDLPKEIQNIIVEKIKSKTNVINPDALTIIKKTSGCEAWLLQNGGECWVEVVRQKTKRKAQIMEVFKQPFAVVNKITKEMNELYESNFKTAYFTYMFEINYLCQVLQNEEISLSDKLEFITLATELIKKISDQLFQLLLKFLVSSSQNENLANKYQKFFVGVMPKLQQSHLQKLFQAKFSQRQQLQSLTQTQFTIFQKCFVGINENIEQQKYSQMLSNGKKVTIRFYTLNSNIQDLMGLQKLQEILFFSKNDQISKKVIKFVGTLLSTVKSEEMKIFAHSYINKLLQMGENLLYQANQKQDSPNKIFLQQKYLKIIQQLLNQTEVKGVDSEPSVNALFPQQKIEVRVVDHFNATKTKFLLEVPSNMTLYEFRCQICKHINAYLHETKIMINGKELSQIYNGHVIHILDLSGDVIINRVSQTQKVNLLDKEGKLVQKAKVVFRNIFREYSTLGLMSKKQCLKYHQKCVGEVMSQGEAKVDKIYDQFDKDKDGYLAEGDFLAFYEASSKTKEHFVWSNLEAFGVRNDLQILDSLPIEYPQRDQLARNKLFDNQKFMKTLFEILTSNDSQLAETAWKFAARLPLYQNFNLQLDLTKEYQTRYWLYVIQNAGHFEKLTKQVLSSALKMSKETVCIALKVALKCQSIDIDNFCVIIENLKSSNSLEHVDFFNKVILDYSLKIFTRFLIKDEKISEYYVANQESINKIFRQGILSVCLASREAYCHTLSELIELAVEKDFKLFQSLFNLIYRIFDNCQLSTLAMQYFELFSHLLEILKVHSQLMPNLGLNWALLTKQIIDIYKSHECTQTSMTSKPDQVAEGLLKIITKLLNSETIQHIIQLIPFIFQQSLFPEKGRNKLKTSKSRQDAYQLIYQICKFEKGDGTLSNGLQKLFDAGFKDIYKKMSAKKSSEIFSYYYYSYNESRSELGYAGIRNLGCICYMIAMLQQLYMTVPFRNLILIADDGQPECLVKKGSKEVDDNIFHQLKNMFGYLLLTEKQEYNPQEFCFSFKDFEGQSVNTSVQQDAQQFINIFFDKLETSLKNTPFKHIFENVFGGRSCSQMTCSGCGAVKERFQNFYPLSLQIKGWKNINQSLNKYTAGQVINDYQCDSCQKKCDVTKRSLLEKTPSYFIVHLQRMCFNYDRLQNEKVNSRWQFPQELNVYDYTLAKYKGIPEVNNQFTYKLRGIVLHYGTADFGHYFSYIKESDNQWLQFNDQRVRQFDPSDIEIQCFGGEHWRRQSQSAYLLVYEREYKSDVVLQFSSQQEKKKTLQQFKLTQAVKQETQQPKNQSESQVSKVDSTVNQEMTALNQKQDEKQKMKEMQNENEQKIVEQPKKILVHLDMQKVGQFVPKPIKDKIDQENDQFSFTMNLSNNQFASFIYSILSIDPPVALKQEYLQLCYQCLNLKQTVKTPQNKIVSISEWASERFTQLIEGHGWEFIKNFGQNWESDILSLQKSTRNVIKCLLHCVINDIIKTNNFNTQFEEVEQNKQEARDEKRLLVINFLDKLLDMMLNQVVKHWARFAEYFELWISLVKQSQFVRRYCEEKMIIQKILDFVMEQGYPYPKAKKRNPMGNQYYPAEFQYPLALMHTLIQNGYQLNQMESNCLKTYSFMSKIILHRVEGANMIETLCKNSSLISQKMGYLLLNNCNSVQQSDQVKPIIASIHQYLKIDDQLKEKRIQWIVGFPVYIEQSREKGFGSYGCIPSTQPAVNFISALGVPPILQQLMKFKKKAQHVGILLLSMLLQLESDGYVNNLDQFPAKMALQKFYTSQFESFVNSYYEDTQRPYTAKNYQQYGMRAKRLWQERPNRPMKSPYPRILLGKVIQQVLVKQENIKEIFEIKQYNIKVFYLPLQNQSAKSLTGKNIVSMKNNQNFVCPNLPKPTKSYGHYNFMRVNSSDEEETQQTPQDSIFEQAKQGWLLRKIQITNRSGDDMLAVFGVSEDTQCNLHIPISPISVQIESISGNSLVLMKEDFEKDFGELNITFNILGKATSAGYMPRQIITEVDQKVECVKAANSDEDEEECSSDAFN